MAKLNPYISFKDQAREALSYYQSVLGGELTISPFSSTPEVAAMLKDQSEAELVMHGQLETPSGITLMAADTGSIMPYVPPSSGMTISLSGDAGDYDYIKGAYDKLSEGGSEIMPLNKAPWGDYFGQLVDKYGVGWMFNIAAE